MSRLESARAPLFASTLVLVGGSLVVGACAQGEVITEDDSGTGASGATTAVGGMGGTGGSATGGSGTGMSLCEIDCSEIATPDCNVAVCNEGQHMGTIGECVVVPDENGAECEDGLFCTVNDACMDGVCVGGPENDCGLDPEACQIPVCDEASQTCSTTPAGNGDPCTSDDLCEVNSTCQNGLCVGQLKDCFFSPVPNECHVAVCDPMDGTCKPEPGNEGLGCTDPNELCTVGKTCSAGTCVGGAPMDCSALTMGCFDGVCDAMSGQCVQQPIAPGGTCQSAADDCNTGVCDMNGSCNPVPANEGGTCEDGNSCTSGETCTMGVCGGGTMVPQTTYFSEDFADNSAGWTLGTTWAIGAAVSSPMTGSCGNGDPGMDNTPTGDNGIAGAVIGGNVATSVHPYYYLTSPVIDTSAVAGSMWLSFYRWLNSDYTSFMNNTVEVYDGATWNLIWESGPPPAVQDPAWNQQAYDISSYKSNVMQIRFGYEIGSSGVYTCSGWNLDDVAVTNVVCP